MADFNGNRLTIPFAGKGDCSEFRFGGSAVGKGRYGVDVVDGTADAEFIGSTYIGRVHFEIRCERKFRGCAAVAAQRDACGRNLELVRFLRNFDCNGRIVVSRCECDAPLACVPRIVGRNGVGKRFRRVVDGGCRDDRSVECGYGRIVFACEGNGFVGCRSTGYSGRCNIFNIGDSDRCPCGNGDGGDNGNAGGFQIGRIEILRDGECIRAYDRRERCVCIRSRVIGSIQGVFRLWRFRRLRW